MDYQDKPVDVAPIPDGYRVSVIGSIHTNVAWLEAELKKVAAHKPKKVEFDLSKMTFVSSMGLGTLVSFRNEILKGGGELKTTAVQKPVMKIIRFAHLQQLLKVDATTQLIDPTPHP
jgi:anti-anti-sigma factor